MTGHREMYPEILRDIGDKVASCLEEGGVSSEAAESVAWQVTEHLRRTNSGGSRYICKRPPKQNAAKDAPLPGQQALFAGKTEVPAEEETTREFSGIIAEIQKITFDSLDGDERAQKLAGKVAAMVQIDLEGSLIYLPKGQRYEHAKRNAEIFDRFSRDRLPVLCAEYGLTEQRIYQILDAEADRRQGDLFDLLVAKSK